MLVAAQALPKMHEGPPSYENDPCDLTPHADQHQHQDNHSEEETINMDSALNCDRNLLWYDLTRSKGTFFHIAPCLLTQPIVPAVGFVVLQPLSGTRSRSKRP